jgi:tetratricopeptide (TPR) repeat protein
MKRSVFFVALLACPLLCFARDNSLADKYSSYLKGLVYSEEGDFRQGVVELEKAKRLDPQSLAIRLKIAALLIRLGEIKRAEVELKEAKKIDSDSFDASSALIFLYSYSQKDKELDREYGDFLKKAHNQKPEDLKISQYLAQFYFYKKEYPRAIGIYEAVVKNDPKDTESMFWLGYLYDETGRRQEAIKIWRRGLDLEPANAMLLNSLAYAYAEDGVKLEEAEGMIKKALLAEPDNGAYLDSLGWIYYKKGEYKKAEEYIKKAVAMIKDPVVYEHAGDICIVLGNKEEGVRYYREGLKNFPDRKQLKEKVEKYGKEDKVIKK